MKRLLREKNTVEMLTEFEHKLNDLKSCDQIQSSDSIYYDDDLFEDWERVATKSVLDSDGFVTEYSLWHNLGTDEWITIFGDTDLYDPTNSEPDMEFEDNEKFARNWFDEYEGFVDEEDY